MATDGMSSGYEKCSTNSSSEEEDQNNIKLLVMGLADSGKKTFVKILHHRWADMSARKFWRGDTDNWFKGKKLVTEIVDTSTSRRLPFLHRLPKCDAFVLVYSMVNPDSFKAATALRNQIVQRKGWSVPIIFVANKLDRAAEVDRTTRVYRDLSVSCDWEHGHYELCAFRALEVDTILDNIRKRIVGNFPSPEYPRRASHAIPSTRFDRLRKIFSK